MAYKSRVGLGSNISRGDYANIVDTNPDQSINARLSLNSRKGKKVTVQFKNAIKLSKMNGKSQQTSTENPNQARTKEDSVQRVSILNQKVIV